jgi:pimeloyl-ACP methyl ester carboxylesterase
MTTALDLRDPALWAADRGYDGEYETRTARVADLEISYLDWGASGAASADAAGTVVLIHGFNVQAHTWDPVASVLARSGYRVLAPDLRGHGLSGWTRSGYHVEQFGDDIAGLLDQLGIGSCAVVGHSLGARVGVALAGRRPGLVSRLALSDTGPEVLRAGAKRATAFGKARLDRRGFNTRQEALAYYQEIHAGWAPVYYELHARHQLRLNWAGKLVDRADPDCFWITRSAGRADDAALWEYARRISIPVLFMYGATSEYTDAPLAERFGVAFGPLFEAVEMPCGHYIPRELPAEFCARLLAFLSA